MEDELVLTEKKEHENKLRDVLNISDGNGLRLKAEKCEFAENEIELLESEVSKKGVVPLN